MIDKIVDISNPNYDPLEHLRHFLRFNDKINPHTSLFTIWDVFFWQQTIQCNFDSNDGLLEGCSQLIQIWQIANIITYIEHHHVYYSEVDFNVSPQHMIDHPQV